MKEFIEIPFGAKDSELGGWEYTIPEGYTASIENGKIIVKKEESDDEKMKKEITELVMQPTWKTEKEFKRRKELCAWLEKQCEQKPTDEEMKILLQTEYEKGKADNIEQNPAWSEEDESMLQNILECLKNGWRKLPTDVLKYESWFQSIKDRVQPQQEYSEDDIRAIDRACVALRAYSNGELPNFLPSELLGYADKLQSLIPQNKWKPSDEQMDALAEALSLAKSCGEESAFDLRTLHEQLKKLRGE